MNTKTKKITIAGLSAMLAATLLSGALALKDRTVFAETDASQGYNYFYAGLTDAEGINVELSKKFYNAFDSMNTDGDFKDGIVDYSLSGIVTSDQIKAWVNGSDVSIPKAFSAARDAYYMDHPELFYIDIYKLTISAACQGDIYTAYIDSGREANLYAKGEFSSEAEVNTAIEAYNAKIDLIAEYATAKADAEQYGTAKKVLQARYANKYLAENTEYDDISAASSAITTASAAQTAYGALVNGDAVCNGYSRAFKAVMDKLEIPCVVVGGYSVSKSSDGEYTTVGEAHAWNYVWFENPVSEDNGGVATQSAEDGAWYGYDVTWNSTGTNVNSYIDMGKFAMFKEHSPDGEISTSGYLVSYPELADYNYGCKTDSNGIVYSIRYDGTSDVDKYGNEAVEIWTSVSFNGKGAIKLYAEDKLRIIYRWADVGEGGVPRWSPWTDLYEEIKIGPFGEDGWGGVSMYVDSVNETRIYGNASIAYIQFAILDGTDESGISPDAAYYPGYDDILTIYNSETDLSEYLVALSDIETNKSYLTYVPAPHVVSSIPDHKQINLISQSWAIPGTNQMDDAHAFDIKVKYHEELKVLDETKPIGISFTSAYLYGTRNNVEDYAHLVPLREDENGNKIYVEIIEDGEGTKNTLHFKFAPSLMYEHNGMHYYFTYSNVGSAKLWYETDGAEYVSGKTPNVVPLRFFREYIACNKCLPNGRMLLDCVAQPVLISNSDLSEMNFKDENDNYFSAGQRSQMMLVVEKPTTEDTAKMEQLLDSNNDINVKKEDIKAAETYEIDLQICGRYTYIPNGSYVKVALGFPEGYGPDDEGVTFKLYHYRRSADRSQIIGVDEIPCVVTRFGIVATIDGFSPFMVVAVDAEKATDKNVYASIDGNGGKLSKEDGQIRTVKEGESYTYTISPDAGYQIYRVTLNGENVTERISNGQLTLTYEELNVNNELVIMYIADAAATRYEQKGVVEPARVVVATDGSLSIDIPTISGSFVPNNPTGSDNPGGLSSTAITMIIVFSVVAVIGGVVICVLLAKMKKPAKQTASAEPAPVATKPAAKSAPAAKPAATAAKPVATTAKPATTAAKPAPAATKPAAAKPATKPAATKPAAKPASGTKPTTKK